MMKDPRYSEAWVDTLVQRIQQLKQFTTQTETPLPTTNNIKSDVEVVAKAAMPPDCRITRSSPSNLTALRSLPPVANILLFTPVITPAGRVLGQSQGETIDPFEAFGRALSHYHRRIRHVPYVSKVGFTTTHEAFISQADAVITMVCEPEHDKHQCMSDQMDFAEDALDALESKEASASHTLVLVQCGDDEYRPPVDASFMNVIESTTYNVEYAKLIARAIFKAPV